MICPNCGKEAADGALFCTGCGGRLDNLPKQEKMTASENSNNDDSSVMDAVFTSDAADGTHETNSENTVAENSDVAGADENSGERMSAAIHTFEQPDRDVKAAADTRQYSSNPYNRNFGSYAQQSVGAANDDNLKAQPANEISTEKDKNAAPCESAAAVQPPVKPLSTWSFIWRKLLFMIPIVNIVVLFVFAFAEGINKNSRSYARAALIGLLTAAVLFAAAAVLCYIYTDEIIGWVRSLVEKLMSMAA